MHIIVEASFKDSHWCSHYIRGITSQAKRKGMPLVIHTDEKFIFEEGFSDTHVIVLGSSLAWSSHYMRLLYAHGIRPIVLSIANYQKVFPYASFITMDYDDASQKLMKYLQNHGCKHTAFFAGNRQSSTDMQKMTNFLQCGGREEDVYNYNGTLKATGDQLLAKIDKYDSVLCANDISAVVLMRRLMDLGYRIPDDIRIATFGDTMLSNLEVKNLAIAQIRSFEAGKLSISAYRMLQSNSTISSLSMLLQCDIFGDNYERADIRLEHKPPVLPAASDPNFFNDEDVEKVILVERLLSVCDKLDVRILREVLNKESYSKIAAKLFIAENTISYRIKKILSMAPDKSKEEIFGLLAQFLF